MFHRLFVFKIIIVSILSIFSGWGCSTASKKPATVPSHFDWHGHRGCRGLLPENSIPSFLHAIDFQEVTTLELDLAVSKDGQLIVSHEPWFNPDICLLPNGDSIPKRDAEKFLIYEMTTEQIRQFDCGSRGNPRFAQQQRLKTQKPTLREVVEAVQNKRGNQPPTIRWNIEIKSRPEWDGVRTPPIDVFAKLVVDEIQKLGITQHTVVQSFDPRAITAIKKLAPQLTIAFLIENIKGLESNLRRLDFQPDIYSPYYLMVSRKLVRKCHARGMKIIPWTVNDADSMRKLIRLGVDGIITDYPDKIAEVMKR